MAFGGFLQANTAVDLIVGPFIDDTDGKTAETGLTVTQAEVRLSKNGANTAQKNEGTSLAHDELGNYVCKLDTTDTNTEGLLTLMVHESGALPIKMDYQVLAQAAYISMITAKDTGFMDTNAKTITAGIIANASFNADVGSTAYATNIIALAVRKVLDEIQLDHLISTAVIDTDVADNSIIAQMVDAGSTSDYTNYSKTEDSQRAISEKVSSIGSASGGGFNFAAVGSDALTDTINDAEGAVDKSTSPATVGIPVDGHAFKAGHEVTIAGTANYNGSFVIDSVSTDEVVIVSAFSVETFSSSDTIVSSIKATSIEGIETTNTFASTVSEDGVYHVIDDDGGNNFTISYRFEVGGGRLATEAVFHGFLSGSNDNAFIQAYDFVGSAWETRTLLTGQNGSVNQTITISLLTRNTGTSGVDLGVVFLRITDDTGRGSSNPTLNVDSLLVEAQGVGQTAGYQNGSIWVDTVNGTAGTESFVNGTADKPVLTWDDALALSSALSITDFHIVNGSTITLSATSDHFSMFGDNWTLALGGRSCVGAYFQGATVSGIATAASEEIHFEGCAIGTASIQLGHFDFCAFSGTVTQTLAGDYEYHNCYSNVAGAGAPTFTKTAGQAITAEWRNWMDSITVSGLQAGDTITINGRLGTVTLNGADATVEIRGSYKSIVNNLTGAPTVNTDGAWQGSDIEDILADTNETQGKLPTNKFMGSSDGADDDGTLDAIKVVTDNTAAAATTLVEGTVSWDNTNATTTVIYSSDITEATADHYNGRIIIFTSGDLQNQATDITDYELDTGEGKFTVTALTEAPADNVTFVIV